jgi:hypothetical protein
MITLKECRQYLIDATQPFEIWTNHANLQYFQKPQEPNRQQAGWLMELQDYNFTIHHIPGKSNSRANFLS